MKSILELIPEPLSGKDYRHSKVNRAAGTHQDINSVQIPKEYSDEFKAWLARLVDTIPPDMLKRPDAKNKIAEHELFLMLWLKLREYETAIELLGKTELEAPPSRPAMGFTGPIDTQAEQERRRLDLKYTRMHSPGYLQQAWTRDILQTLASHDARGGFGKPGEQLINSFLRAGDVYDLMVVETKVYGKPVGILPHKNGQLRNRKDAVPIIGRGLNLMRTARTEKNTFGGLVSYCWFQGRLRYGPLSPLGVDTLAAMNARPRNLSKPDDDYSDHWQHMLPLSEEEDEADHIQH